ncbi:MAG: GDP-mannose 4,6-dehydratase [Phycisphaerae bacterium]|nr:GDP-mannose 4,6-dehydratase [Phycisphaerae bacterium]
MNVLVTGGAGFIGSHLVGQLLEDGHAVWVIDNLSTGSLENLKAYRGQGKLTFIRGDIRDGELVQLVVKDVDQVYHLAAAVGVQLIAKDPVWTIETNIGGTETVLEKANRFGRKVFLASTSEVYGKSVAVPFREEDDFILGSTAFSRWSYACSKAIDEFLGQAYYEQYGLGVVIGRFFNTVGPRQTGQYGMVVPRFVQWALNSEPVQIYGDGQQTRCFSYVGDVVDAVIRLMACDEAEGKVFNIGSNHEITMEQLADRVIDLCASSSKKQFVSYEDAYGRAIEDMARRVPCLDRIKQMIQWQPSTSLDDTLKMVIDSKKHTIDSKKSS